MGRTPGSARSSEPAAEAAMDEAAATANFEAAAASEFAPKESCTSLALRSTVSDSWAPSPSSYGKHSAGSKDEACMRRDESMVHASSTTRGNDLALHSKIKAFDDMRQEERLRMFNVVLSASTRLLTLGCLVSAAGQVCRWLVAGYGALAILIPAFMLLACGLVIGSACPYDLLDFNQTSRQKPKTMTVMMLMMMLISASQVLLFPHLDGVEILLCAAGIVSVWERCCPSWWPHTTTFLSFYLIADQFDWGFILLFDKDLPAQARAANLQARATIALGGFNLITAVPILGLWLWRMRQSSRSKTAGSSGPCMACYEVLYGWLLCLGISVMAEGLAQHYFPQQGTSDDVRAMLTFTRGAVIFTPAAVVLILGRYRLFHLLGRSFDRDGARLRRDGAFVAELLDTVEVQVGQLWWIHRDDANEQYAAFDHRRHWQQGVVVELAGDEGNAALEFDVQLQEEARTSLFSENRTSLVSDMSNRLTLGKPKEPGRKCHVQLSQSASKSKEELLWQAQKKLRCVDFERLSPDLMKRVDSSKDPELQAAWHALSRPVNKGEKIDYFMSNSWYDDPVLKWEKLTEVAEKFYKKTGRYPTFWLDKLCIDQTSVADGLKVLPVNVMACQKLLVLCGDTYLSRLWCIWELFTLFAFVSEQAALDRVEFVFLGDYDDGIEMLNGMKSFHVKDAHCYDPNEEARLRQVIDAVGTARFNKRISDLASATLLRLEQQRKKRFVNAVGKTRSTASVTSERSAQDEAPQLPDV